jgi:hypothetical protein
MTDRQPTETRNLDIYGNEALTWPRAEEALARSNTADITWFLVTADAASRPHTAGIGALWEQGNLYFTSGPSTRKSKNVAANPRVNVGVRLEGIDLVFEGTAARVTDGPTLEQIAAKYREGGWPVQAEGDAFTAPFSAPSAGPPPWYLYQVAFDRVYGVATEEPHGATRWLFDQG